MPSPLSRPDPRRATPQVPNLIIRNAFPRVIAFVLDSATGARPLRRHSNCWIGSGGDRHLDRGDGASDRLCICNWLFVRVSARPCLRRETRLGPTARRLLLDCACSTDRAIAASGTGAASPDPDASHVAVPRALVELTQRRKGSSF